MEGKFEEFLHMIRCSWAGMICAESESHEGSARDSVPNQAATTLKKSW
jgi:hypothetical protein